MTETRSQKYLLATCLCLTQCCIFVLPDYSRFKSSDVGITVKAWALSKMLLATYFVSRYFTEVEFLTNKTSHGPHTSILQNSCKQPLWYSHWEWTITAGAQAKARSPNLCPRSQRSSLPSALSQAMCWVTAFRNPLRKPGNLAPSVLRTGQSKYTISTFLQPLIMFSLEQRDTGREETP